LSGRRGQRRLQRRQLVGLAAGQRTGRRRSATLRPRQEPGGGGVWARAPQRPSDSIAPDHWRSIRQLPWAAARTGTDKIGPQSTRAASKSLSVLLIELVAIFSRIQSSRPLSLAIATIIPPVR